MNSQLTGDTTRFTRGLVLILLAGIAIRLPQLLGSNLGADGDEAIVGLMTLHFLDGEAVPVFFYGQKYGFSLLEVVSASLTFAVLGPGVLALKLSALGIWTVGAGFFAIGMRRIVDSRAGLWAAGLLVTLPAWMVWSMKARGGYVTAFLGVGILVWLCSGYTVLDRSGHSSARRRLRALAIGFVAAIVCLAQPFFFVVGSSCLAGFLWRRFSWREFTILAVGLAVTVALFTVLISPGAPAWSPPLFRDLDPLAAATRVPGRLAVSMSGIYYYLLTGSRSLFESFLGAALGLLVAVCLGLSIQFAGKRRGPTSGESSPQTRSLWVGVGLGIVAPVGISLVMNVEQFAYRYMLPISIPLVIGLSMSASSARARWVLGPVVALGLLSSWSSSQYSLAVPPGLDERVASVGGEEGATDALVADLEGRGIGHVYTLDPMYQWSIIFASQERVLARWRNPRDRVPGYGEAVDEALRSGLPTALVGSVEHADAFDDALSRAYPGLSTRRLAGRHFILEDPPEEMLRKLGYGF